jgi:hypothetical protein
LLSVFHDIIKKAKLTKIPWIISQKADARKKTNKAKVDRYGKLDLDHCTKIVFHHQHPSSKIHHHFRYSTRLNGFISNKLRIKPQ